MAIKRSFSITVTMKTGDPITLDGKQALDFWTRFDAYTRGQSVERGVMIPKSDGSACIYMFENVVTVCRTAQTETTVEDDGCKDIDCDIFGNVTTGGGE